MPNKEDTTLPNRIAAFILFATLACAPLPFGSRDSTTIAFWCFLLGVGLIVAFPRDLRGGHLALLAGAAFIMACYGFVLHEQLADHPWIAEPNPIWAKTSELLGRPVQPIVSIVRGEPFYALGAPLAVMLSLLLGLIVGANRDSARQAFLVMAWSGVAYAVYGIFALLLEPMTILWREKTAYIGNVTGTFINRNTAGAYFGSCAVVWLVLFMQEIRSRLPRSQIVWKEALGHILSEGQQNRGLVIRFCMLFVCLAAMFMTGSRGGVLVSLLGLSIAFVAFFRRDLPRGKGVVVVIAAAFAMMLMLLEFMGGNVGNRFDVQGLSDEGRLSAYRSTLRMIADHPWFGTGLGTFAWDFPAYRDADISMFGIWDRAHSTPLELAAEVGIPLTALVAAGWIAIFIVLTRGVGRQRREMVIPLAALTVALIALLHSSIDFSLQTSGYAIVVFALIGLGLSQSFHDPIAGGYRRRRNREADSHVAVDGNPQH